MALPANVGYCRIKGRFMRAILDGPDPDRDPDGVPVAGLTLTFTADIDPAIVRNPTAAPPVAILIDKFVAHTNANGVLIGDDDVEDILVVASDDEDLDPHGWTYTCRISGPSFPVVTITFVAPVDGVIDLATVIPIPPSPGSALVAWQAAVATTLENKIAAQVAEAGAVDAKNAAVAVGTTNDTIMAAVAAAPASEFGTQLSTTIVDEITGPGNDGRDAVDALFGNRVAPIMYDEFSTVADGPLLGRSPIIGPVWRTTGAQPVIIDSGRATSTGTGYAFAKFDRQPDAVWADVAFAGDPLDKTMTVALCQSDDSEMLNTMVHLNYGATGFTLTARRDGELAFPVLMVGLWKVPIPVDGVTYRKVGMSVREDTVTVFGPNGEIRSLSDARVSAVSGRTAFWEPRAANASVCYISSVTASDHAVTGASTGQAALSDITNFQTDNDGRVVGNPNSTYEASLGIDPISRMPSLVLGASEVRTYLLADVAVGATTIFTEKPISPGSTLTFESGDVMETAITGGYSTGISAPFATPITTPLVKVHPDGAFVGAKPQANARVSMSLNVANGQVFLPNTPVLVAPGGKIYLGGLDAFIERTSAGVIGARGGWRFMPYTTALRPSTYGSAEAGVGVFDTTLKKPIWWNGTAWVDATGATV